MRILVAREFEPGRWQRIAVVKASDREVVRGSQTSYNVPAKHRGTAVSHVIRKSVDFFRADKAAATIFYDSLKMRVDRIVES